MAINQLQNHYSYIVVDKADFKRQLLEWEDGENLKCVNCYYDYHSVGNGVISDLPGLLSERNYFPIILYPVFIWDSEHPFRSID